jgi:hypothetical protein
MHRKIVTPLLLAMSLATAVTANATTVSTGSISFNGRVFIATEVVNMGPDGNVQPQRAATRVSSQRLADAKPIFHINDANDLFDYFAGYARTSATVITVIYR